MSIKSSKCKTQARRDCSVVSESGEVCWEELMRKFSESHSRTCKTAQQVSMPKIDRSLKEFPTGSKYEGSWNVLGLSGKGIYHFPHGVIYKGDFEDGEFHGEGELHYENGVILRGKFDRGTMTERTLTFGDGLVYSETDWKYCELPDRRFTVEYELGMRAAGESVVVAEEPKVDVPMGHYDTGDGFFDPKSKLVFKRDCLTDIVRAPSQQECEWIMRNCRQCDDAPLFGPHPELYEEWVLPELELQSPPPPAAYSGGLFRFSGDESDEEFDFEAYEDPSFRITDRRRSTISKGKIRLFYKEPTGGLQ